MLVQGEKGAQILVVPELVDHLELTLTQARHPGACSERPAKMGLLREAARRTRLLQRGLQGGGARCRPAPQRAATLSSTYSRAGAQHAGAVARARTISACRFAAPHRAAWRAGTQRVRGRARRAAVGARCAAAARAGGAPAPGQLPAPPGSLASSCTLAHGSLSMPHS